MNLKEVPSRVGIAIREVVSNRLTAIFLLIGVVFWMVIAPLDQNWPLFAVRIMLIGVSAAIALSYLLPALSSVRTGDVGGVTQWLVGIVFYFLAICAGSLYSITWYGMDRPDWMTTHPLLTFILLSQALGAILVLISPNAGKGEFPVQNVSIAVVIALLVGVVVGAIGTKALGAEEPARHANFSATYPVCNDRGWWGNVSGKRKIYHGPDSPYRAQVVPERCFETEEQAQAAGFRAPN